MTYVKSFSKLIFLILMHVLSVSANANDSVASVASGGLVLLKTDDIEMVSEVLEISTSKIKVSYRFLNTSDKDVKTTVAFPMPTLTNDIENLVKNFSDTYEQYKLRPLDSFRSYVNGNEIKTKLNRQFHDEDDKDITDKLRQIGLTDEQIFDINFKCFGEDPLPPYTRSQFCKINTDQAKIIKSLLSRDGGSIHETAYWEQTFPAGKEIEVVHEYQPFVGMKPYNGRWYFIKDYIVSDNQKEACLTGKIYNDFISAYKNAGDDIGKIQGGIRRWDVEYILGTGRNWKGPIRKFKLILIKNLPSDQISLCFPGKPVQTSPLTLEITHLNYMPQDKLRVYYFTRGI